jgi:hypothetical protein
VDHQIHIQLPDTIPTGHAKIAIIYELPEPQPPAKNQLMAEFLNSLPEIMNKSGLNREQIQAYINEERASWDDEHG